MASVLGVAAVFLALSLQSPNSQAQGDTGFDHNTTLFALEGLHEQVRCESCHIKGIFKGTPRDCAGCHLQNNQRGAKAKPVNHIQSSNNCEECHSVTSFTVARFNHATVSPGTCAGCHDGRRATGMTATHFPTTESCDQCHLASAFLPITRFDHEALAGDISTCARCHNGAIAKGMPSNHLPRSLSIQCGSCHVASTQSGFKSFSGGQVDHTGLNTGCADCHGPNVGAGSFAGISRIIVMPPTAPAGPNSHIPSSTTCESCHLGSMPAGLVAANAVAGVPGSGFATPVPTSAQIHAGVTSGCSNCHETSYTWLGMSYYPMVPATFVPKARYTGFHARPKAVGGVNTIADAAHPDSGDCAECHTGTAFFYGEGKPSNHIPVASGSTCTACHTAGGDFSAMPTLTNIHANAPTSGGCAQCHGASVAPSFAIPVNGFSVTAPPSNHMPITTACETCHVGAGSSLPTNQVIDGARFSGSLMSHAGITNNCASCHGPAISGASFVGVSSIVVMPPTSPAGPSAHIPSSTTCENCHMGSTPAGQIPASAGRTAPGTAFASPAPTSAQIHMGVTGGCNSCHDVAQPWMGMGAYPIAPTTRVSGAQYNGFHLRPKSTGGTYTIADAAHPTGGDCGECHSSFASWSGVDKPINHIPYASSAACSACHTSSNFATMPTLADIHANAPSRTNNCAQCHGANVVAGFAIPSANFTIKGPPANHMPITTACESCHVGAGSSITSLPVGNGASFAGSLMSHAGITNNCAACHGPSINGASFAGVSAIVVIPPKSPAGPTSHIPSSDVCEACHLGSTPAGLIPASSTKTAPGTAFATPAPTGAMIHAGITGGCNTCHEAGNVWMGMAAYPISPSVKTTGGQYRGFNTRPRAAASTYSVADATHPATRDCAECHSNTNYFAAGDKPANHIPYASAAACSACHTTGDYSAMPTLANIHANAPSTTTNCAQCHGANVVAGFAIPAANFTIMGPPSNHMPITTGCEACHVGTGSSVATTPVPNGAKFSGSLMSHTGITSNCVACHAPSGSTLTFAGISRIVGMPPTAPMGPNAHIPSSTACERCHLGSTPAGLVPASATKTAPGTAFATPAPTAAQIHAGITSGCNTCHESGSSWMGMDRYPITPTVKSATPGTKYNGFHTRPRAAAGTYNVADASHPSTKDCSECHSGTSFFTGQDKPANHIPYAATAQCTSCHTSSDYSVMPTLANIHAYAPNTKTNCAQCHGAGVVAGFAIPGANFTIMGPPSNHMPISTACEVCHVGPGSSVPTTPVPNGAKFSGSLMSHTGITNNCVVCHGPGINGSSFAGVSKIVVMPPTSPMGASAHIPSSTACEACHLGSTPAGMVPASATKSAPGSAFATPVPTGPQIHAGTTSGCNSCHEAAFVWMGMERYPITPKVKSTTVGTQYRGFQTRPRAAAGTYNVADAAHPSTRDCSECHSGTTFFQGVDKPANHIPYVATAQCSSCHTSSDYSVMPTLTNIHAYAPSKTANCAQCHAANVVAGFAIPGANFTIKGPPANHIPITTACEVCHVGTGSSIATTPVLDGAKFSGSLMSHKGITTNCVSCHAPAGATASFAGITRISGMPPTSPAGASAHIPSSTTCEACHLGSAPAALVPASATKTAPGTAWATPVPTGAMIHAGITSGCNACHDTNYVWMGMSHYPMTPSTLTSGAQYKGFNSRPTATGSTYAIKDGAHPVTGDCGTCHTGTTFFEGDIKPSNHIPYAATAACTACHTNPDFSVMPTLANIHAYAQSTSANCAQCHAASVVDGFAIPAANFTIKGPPANHIPITTACEVCHVGTGSSIAATPVPNGAKFSASLMSHKGITTNCVSCHVTSGTTVSFAGITRISGMPPTSPMGASAHIPSSTTCEACHLGSAPANMVPASATKTAPGTAWATPVPTGPMIHAGITGSCNTCHDTNYVWMGMSHYPMTPATLSTNTSTQYKGFNSRPTTTGSTYAIKDAAHPTTGDCSTCHVGTTYFSGAAKPNGHLPTTQTCSTCHIVAGDFSIAGLTKDLSINGMHKGVTSATGCRQCHAAGPFAGCTTQATCATPPALTYQPKKMPLATGGSATAPSKSTHVPVGVAECGTSCHANFTSFTGMNMKNNATAHGMVKGQTCMSCHEQGYTWFGVTIKIREAGESRHNGTVGVKDCTASGCHSATKFSGFFGIVRPVLRSAIVGARPRLLPGMDDAVGGASGAAFSHQGVLPNECATCHNGQAAKGLPAKHLQTKMSCDACHRTTAWKPAEFSHQGVPFGQCQACHNGLSAPGKPGNHFVTSRSCDACHLVVGWQPVTYKHISPQYRAEPDKTNCVSCHITNGEIIPRQLRGGTRPRPTQ
ncbi:MAG: hypothetical protein KA375_05760 [Vitreoscilla sp.]|nr:hypothetical protein [Vitreoscilla sp.]